MTTAPEPKESSWRIDPARSSISFEARWMFGICTARGVFERTDGWVSLRSNGSLVGELTIDASSVNTGNRLRDRHLRNRLFLGSRRHPTIALTSKAVRISGTTMTGDGYLSVRGRTVKTPVSGTVRMESADQMSVSGSATLDVRQFGWPTGLGYIRRSLVVNAAVSLSRRG